LEWEQARWVESGMVRLSVLAMPNKIYSGKGFQTVNLKIISEDVQKLHFLGVSSGRVERLVLGDVSLCLKRNRRQISLGG
jgi:hypothetical protein